MQVTRLGRDKHKEWDELVDKCVYSTIFHRSLWLDTCARSLNRGLRIYACRESGELVGGCSLYVHRSKGLRRAHSTVPLTPYGGVVLAQSESANVRRREERQGSVIHSLQNAFESERFDYIQIVNPPGFVDVRPFAWNGWDTNVRYAYYFDLENYSQDVLSKEVRWTIRKAAENGVTVKKLDDPDISIYYRLLSMTFSRQNLKPPVSIEFLQEAVGLLNSKHAAEMWVAETASGDVAAAEIIVLDVTRAYRWSAASHTDFKHTGATSLLLCEVFRELKRRGFKEIDLMAANTPQLAKFVAGFNPALIPYYSVEKKTGLLKISGIIHNATRDKWRGFH